jgi:hypothetical protein
MSGDQDHIWSRPLHLRDSGDVSPFTGGGTSGLRILMAPHVTKDSTPITVFLLLFMEVIQILVTETNK